jgi:hypothetical protein
MNMRERMSATGPTNVAAVSPVINFNGSTAAQPEAIGQKVVGAMRMSTKEMLASIKAARAEEARLGYV